MKRTLTTLLFLVATAPVWGQPTDALPGVIPASEHEAERAEARGQAEDARKAVAEKARMLGYTEAEITRVMQPTMVRSGEFEVTLEDGTRIRFPWFRTGFAENPNANTERGIDRTRGETNKGGVRLHRGVFAEEVYALALKMDAKLAITGDAVGGEAVRGAKGGIGAGRVVAVGSRYSTKVGDVVDPASSVLDRAEMMRGFGDGYLNSGARVGLGRDIHAGDVNTKAPEMRILSNTYDPSAPSEGVSGKELLLRADGTIDPRGGIEYRGVSTGEGVWMSARHGLGGEGIALEKATVVSQGWGEVGKAFGLAAVRDGARLVGIQELWNVGGETVPGLLKHPKGERASAEEVKAWVEAVEELRGSRGDLKTFRNGELFRHFDPRGDVSRMKVDVVGYNALGNVLNETSVPELAESGTSSGKRKIIVEGANLAETAEGAKALDALRAKLVTIPGDLANLGGVHVSNLEAVQNRFGEVITSEQARESLERAIREGWERALELSKKHDVSMRKAIELLSADELMKRSLQRPDATKNSLEKGTVSSEAIAAYEARQAESPRALERVLARLKPYRRADGTLRWGEVAGKRVLSEGAGAAHFALALFLKEVAVVASTGDRARIEEFFDGLATTDFYKHYGLFVAGARVGEIGYTRYLQRYIKPRFVNGLLKTNLILAAGLALPMIMEGQFSGKALTISVASLGLSTAAVRTGVRGLAWVLDLRKAQQTGALAKLGAGAGRLARLGGWFYTAAELAVILYVGEKIEERIREHMDLAAARDELAKAGQRLLGALADPSADSAKAVADYGDAWTAYRNFLYQPLEMDEAVFAERLAKLARRAKLAANERTVAVAKLAKFPGLRRRILGEHGSIETYADSLVAKDEAEISAALEKYTASYEAARNGHLKEVYEDHRREGDLLTGLDDREWLLDGAPVGTAADPWGERGDLFARWGRSRSRAALEDAFEGASRNRLQTYEDEAEVLTAIEARLRTSGRTGSADALATRRERVRAIGAADARLVSTGGLVEVGKSGGLGDALEGAGGD